MEDLHPDLDDNAEHRTEEAQESEKELTHFLEETADERFERIARELGFEPTDTFLGVGPVNEQ